jgi:hypothetical protein
VRRPGVAPLGRRAGRVQGCTNGPAIEEYASGWAEGYGFALAVVSGMLARREGSAAG